MTTIRPIATTRYFGSISMPLIFMSGENPIMPAEVIGIETFSCFIDIEIRFDANSIKAFTTSY